MKVIPVVTETLKYEREVPFVLPEGMSEDEFESVLDKVQRNADSTDDFIYGLEAYGIKQQGDYDSSFDSPSYFDAECDEYEVVDESE